MVDLTRVHSALHEAIQPQNIDMELVQGKDRRVIEMVTGCSGELFVAKIRSNLLVSTRFAQLHRRHFISSAFEPS